MEQGKMQLTSFLLISLAQYGALGAPVGAMESSVAQDGLNIPSLGAPRTFDLFYPDLPTLRHGEETTTAVPVIHLQENVEVETMEKTASDAYLEMFPQDLLHSKKKIRPIDVRIIEHDGFIDYEIEFVELSEEQDDDYDTEDCDNKDASDKPKNDFTNMKVTTQKIATTIPVSTSTGVKAMTFVDLLRRARRKHRKRISQETRVTAGHTRTSPFSLDTTQSSVHADSGLDRSKIRLPTGKTLYEKPRTNFHRRNRIKNKKKADIRNMVKQRKRLSQESVPRNVDDAAAKKTFKLAQRFTKTGSFSTFKPIIWTKHSTSGHTELNIEQEKKERHLNIRENSFANEKLGIVSKNNNIILTTRMPSIQKSMKSSRMPSYQEFNTVWDDSTSMSSYVDSSTFISMSSGQDDTTSSSMPSYEESPTSTGMPSYKDLPTTTSMPSYNNSPTTTSMLAFEDPHTTHTVPSYKDSSSSSSMPSYKDSPTSTGMQSYEDSPTTTSIPLYEDAPISMPSYKESPTSTSMPSYEDSSTSTSRPSYKDSPTSTSMPSYEDSSTSTSMPSYKDSPTSTSMPSYVESPTTAGMPSKKNSPISTSMSSYQDSPTSTNMPSYEATPTSTLMPSYQESSSSSSMSPLLESSVSTSVLSNTESTSSTRMQSYQEPATVTSNSEKVVEDLGDFDLTFFDRLMEKSVESVTKEPISDITTTLSLIEELKRQLITISDDLKTNMSDDIRTITTAKTPEEDQSVHRTNNELENLHLSESNVNADLHTSVMASKVASGDLVLSNILVEENNATTQPITSPHLQTSQPERSPKRINSKTLSSKIIEDSITLTGLKASQTVTPDEVIKGQYHEINPGQYHERNPGQYHEVNPGQYHETNPGQYNQIHTKQDLGVENVTVDFDHEDESRIYNVQANAGDFIIGEVGRIDINSGQTFQGVRYTAVEGEVDKAQISDILERYFGARAS